MPSNQTNPVLSSIDLGVALASPEVTVYFAKNGESFDIVENQGRWTPYAREQAMAALDAYAAVSGLTFSVTNDPEDATLRLTKSEVNNGGSLGFTNPPDPAYGDTQGIVWFNSGPYWSGAKAGLLDPGSYMYTIFLHEFGHGLGLAHPFDTGGESTIMPSIGDGMGLDQGAYTVMTYNDGWPEAPEGLPDSPAWGWNLGPSALDIAVIQAKYGVNTETGAGKTRYVLPSENEAGTGYLAIWDAGGRDTMVHKGSAAALIDLRAATLKAGDGGGGWVSHVSGIHGGFTIANGVVIEKALGGSGSDTLIGNGADNVLNGRGGTDEISGGAGADRLIGGGGADVLDGGRGRDVLTGGAGPDTFVIAPRDGRDRVTDFAANDLLDLTAFGFDNFGEVTDAMSQSGNALRIDLDRAVLILKAVEIADITEDMVLI